MWSVHNLECNPRPSSPCIIVIVNCKLIIVPNGTLKAMNFEKTDAKQAEKVHASADMDFVFASKLQTVRSQDRKNQVPCRN